MVCPFHEGYGVRVEDWEKAVSDVLPSVLDRMRLSHRVKELAVERNLAQYPANSPCTCYHSTETRPPGNGHDITVGELIKRLGDMDPTLMVEYEQLTVYRPAPRPVESKA
jgi:hypothetical protein